MSKEREMIEKLCSFQMTYSDWLLLIADAEELLAQPEQEQEPVAWMYDWYEGDTESTSTYCGSEKPFQEDEVKPFNLRPLYEHPKREPLSDKDIGKGFLLTDVWHRYECFIAGVKWAERQHGIGGGEC